MPTALGTVASHRTVTAAPGPVLTNLQLWLDATDETTFTYSSGAVVSEWRDKLGNGRNGGQATVPWQPTRNGSINGITAVLFNTPVNQQHLTFSPFASSFTSAELFMVVKLVNLLGNGASEGGLQARWGGSQNCHYPYSNGHVYEAWGQTTRPDLGVPPFALTNPHIYNLRSASGSYIAAMNGTVFYTSGTNTVTFSSSSPYELVQQSGSGAHANIGELLMYDRVLNTTERQQVESYLNAKWFPPPPIPTSGLQGWFDASDASTFTYFAGSEVSQWNDKSGNNFHATAINSDWEATRVTNAINGLAAVDFHPGSLNTTAPGNLKPVTIIVAVKTGATTGSPGLIGTNWGESNSGPLSWDHSNGLLRLLRQNVALIGQATSVFTANAPAVLGMTYGSNDVWTFYRNGVETGTGTTAGTFAAGTHMLLGGLGGPNNGNYDGLFGEVVVYDRVLSTVERQQVESYLKTKWGTP